MSILRRLLRVGDAALSRVGNPKSAARAATDVSGVSLQQAGTSTAIQLVIARANTHQTARRYVEALSIIMHALAGAPDDATLLLARASTLFAWSRFREALAGYRQIVARGFEHEDLFLQLGWAHYYTGHLDEAETWMRKAAALAADAGNAHHGLALVLLTLGKVDEAIAICESALNARSDDSRFLLCFGQCKLQNNNPTLAEAAFRRALALDDSSAMVWHKLGIALDHQDRLGEALEAFQRAECQAAENHEDTDSFVNAACVLHKRGNTAAALNTYGSNLAQRPAAVGHRALAETLLSVGRFVEGWHQYEFRWLLEPLVSTRLGALPMWSGQDLHGKTILLRIEQGFGDTFQCLRYAPVLKTLGATVLLGNFCKLAGGFAGIDRIVEGGVPVGEIDYYVHLLSLPRVFGTDLESIPADIPYVNADPLLVERWASRIVADGTLKVGLVWAGNPAHLLDRKRSMKLRTLMPLLMLEGVRFYGLQKGPPAVEAEAMPADVGFVNVGPELDDFADTAAVISQLDLVICVDTAVGHLAGAMGKPVWLLLPQPADFRWLEEREDSPWYPTMRLFRQRGQQDWEEVVRRVEVALRKRVEGDMSQMMPEANRRTRNTRAMVQVANAWPPPGHRPGFSAVAETRVGILQYLPDEPELGVSIGWYGEYLQSQLELLMQRLQPGMTVMEVAAGVGAHAMLLARMVGATGHLFLYESRPIVRRILQQNLTANRVVNVTLMRRALSRPGASTVDSAGPSGPSTETLDELQLERLDWLKVGDGAIALAVLEGAADALWRLRPQLFLAATDAAMLAQLAQRARDYGYRCWRMETPLFNPANFNRRTDDRFAGRSALALLAIPEEITVNMAFDGGVEL